MLGVLLIGSKMKVLFQSSRHCYVLVIISAVQCHALRLPSLGFPVIPTPQNQHSVRCRTSPRKPLLCEWSFLTKINIINLYYATESIKDYQESVISIVSFFML